MDQITCLRCGKEGEQLQAPPLPSEIGDRIYDSICGTCWDEWLQHQTALINHHSLNLLDAEARKFLTKQVEVFLFDSTQNDTSP